MTKCHVRGEEGSAGAATTQVSQFNINQWHSADEEVTKCHVRGEEGSAGATTTQVSQFNIDQWRSGSAEDS